MADAYITLVSIQPAVAVRTLKGQHHQNHPQSQGDDRGAAGGLYASRRKKQTLRGKGA